MRSPLLRYRDDLRGAYHRLAEEAFAKLVLRSGINIAANRATLRALAASEREAQRQVRLADRWSMGILAGFGILAAAPCALLLLPGCGQYALLLWGLAAAGLTLGCCCTLKRRARNQAAEAAQQQAAAFHSEARAQMAPLNRLYPWGLATALFQQLLPECQFDPCIRAERQALFEAYAAEALPHAEPTCSLLCAESGELCGNSFLYGRTLSQFWTEERYSASRVIVWHERVRDGSGRVRYTLRTGTVSASVVKPKPAYAPDAFLAHLNTLTPTLSFTHTPSPFSHAKAGFLTNLKRKRALRKLEAFSQNLDDDSDFTLMGNETFELLFHTPDRTDEHAFRRLFTPAAQQNMLEVMQDQAIGFGDDFTFRKRGALSLLTAEHFSLAALSTHPARFHSHAYDQAKAAFLDFHDSYFRSVYCAFLPLLAIPAFQAPAPPELRLPPEAAPTPSAWELETLANALPQAPFLPLNAEPNAILKASPPSRDPSGCWRCTITAYAFSAHTRTEHCTVLGPDGRSHTVAVKWCEYRPRTKRTSLLVAPSDQAPFKPALVCRGLAVAFAQG